MNAKHRGIQILGWLSALVGYGLALVLIRGIYLGITRGFGTAPFQAFWVALGYLVFFGLAAYLVILDDAQFQSLGAILIQNQGSGGAGFCWGLFSSTAIWQVDSI